MSRQGPPTVAVAKCDASSRIELSDNNLIANNRGSSFDTVKANVKVRRGKWYYEIKLNRQGTIQLGWCNDSFRPDASAGNGVGDDSNSWAYDGSRQQKWHAGSTYYGQYWSNGDVIGCAVDLDNKKMHFFRNGSDLGEAFDGFSVGEGFYPAVTLSANCSVTFNFGKTNFRYPHPNTEFKMIHCNLSAEELASLTRVFEQYKNVGINLSESGETGDSIKGSGLLEYGNALGVTEDTDPGLLIVLWKLDASTQWELSRDEFVGGWTTLGTGNIDGMKNKLVEWRRELDTTEHFRKFYFWVFDYLREEHKTILTMEECTTIWSMLDMDKKWKLWPKFAEYLELSKTRALSKDTWRQLYDFMRVHPNTLDNYDDAGSWPVLVDEFVIWSQTGQLGDEF
eukprot:TRINITY_DN680_c0_g1_i1.p1 TRINITY_DN680_c0_g1~~TRINITY_DN680_c0_g1_i1.p1  ORF type:complete len:395 (+),score=66.43 TRINITY_DN680_c0_g1_i1:102-1286(+)